MGRHRLMFSPTATLANVAAGCDGWEHEELPRVLGRMRRLRISWMAFTRRARRHGLKKYLPEDAGGDGDITRWARNGNAERAYD